jgi:hypothetical protein
MAHLAYRGGGMDLQTHHAGHATQSSLFLPRCTIIVAVKTKDQIREIFREVISSTKDFSVPKDFQARHTEDALRCTHK